MKLSRESWSIAAIGIADLLTTILFIELYGAAEANPLFHYFWEMGLLAFILAKIVFILGPITIFEWARARRPRFVLRASRAAIAAYLILDGIGVAHLNAPMARAQEAEQPLLVRYLSAEAMQQKFPTQLPLKEWGKYRAQWLQTHKSLLHAPIAPSRPTLS